MPNIAQNGINSAELFMESQMVTAPNGNGVHIQLVTISKSKSPFHPWLDGFRAALFLEESKSPNGSINPFGYIDIPRVKALASARITVDQVMEIVDQEQFALYNKRVMANETYRVGVKGRTGLKEGSFPKTTVNFNKIITSKGGFCFCRVDSRGRILTNVQVSTGSKVSRSVTLPSALRQRKMAPT